MEYQLIDEAEVTEPVTLLEQKAFSRIDADYSADDNDIQLMITAARQRLELYLNVGFVKREVKVLFNGSSVKLPLYPNGDISSVTDGTDPIPADKYHVGGIGLKTIVTGGAFDWHGDWFYTRCGEVEFTPIGRQDNTIYNVTYDAGYEILPQALKMAMMAECDYMIKLLGQPILEQISPNAMSLSQQYSQNLVL